MGSKITIFKNFSSTNNPYFIEVDDALERVKNGKSKDLIETIRQEEDSKKRALLKRQLPCVLFSGEFKYRNDKSISNHSGLAILDFDHIDDLDQKKNELFQNEYIYSVWVSPSGDGLKALVRVPKEIENHRVYYEALVQEFPEIDTSNKNESRICYESYDPELLKKELASVSIFNKQPIIEKESNEESIESIKEEVINTDYSKVEIALRIVRGSKNGEKHSKLLSASHLLGGYIRTGYVEYDEAVRLLTNEIKKKDIDDEEAAITTIIKGIEQGMSKPLEHDTRPNIIYLDDVRDKMLQNYDMGGKKGDTTHIKEVDDIFKWRRGFMNILTGYMNQGKTQLLSYMLLAKSISDGSKWALFTPEGNDAEDFYEDLCHTYIGKPTLDGFGEKCTKKEYEDARNFINEHFFFVMPNTFDYFDVLKTFQYLIDNKGIYGVVIDGYNSLSFNSTSNEYLIIRNFLIHQRNFTVQNDIASFVVVHPRNTIVEKKEELPEPEVFSLSGGAEWGNKADTILVYNRPYFRQDITDTTCSLTTKKMKKQKLMAIPGTIKFSFNRYSNRYMFNGVDRLEEIKNGHSDDNYISKSDLKKVVGEENNKDFNQLVDQLYDQQEELPF
jgi:twinkle protein